MEKLPSEIMLNILSRLPYETIIDCELACKPWRGFKLSFGGGEQYDDIDMHGHYSDKILVETDNHRSVDLEPTLSDMIGSCNGLVCFSVKGKSPIADDDPVVYICNPITEEYVYLPNYNHDTTYGSVCGFGYSHSTVCGFGYSHSTNEYKVVRIHSNDIFFRKIYVYTLGSGHGWRFVGQTDPNRGSDPGVFANGALHWIRWDLIKCKIMAFELADEKFRLIPSAPLTPQRSNDNIQLRLFEEYLCIVHTDTDYGYKDGFIYIWALEKKKKVSNYDMKEHEFNDFWRWSMKFRILSPKGVIYEPFAVAKGNQVLMSCKESVYCYDPETTRIRKLWYDRSRRIIQAFPHVNSLVSLKALGEKSKRRRYPQRKLQQHLG